MSGGLHSGLTSTKKRGDLKTLTPKWGNKTFLAGNKLIRDGAGLYSVHTDSENNRG
jgi:hypothetical protein